MGIGNLGNNTFIRKWRWTISTEFDGHLFPETFVRVSQKPEVKNLFSDNICSVTFYEIGTEIFKNFYGSWIPYACDSYKHKVGIGWLKLYDGCGCLLETWTMSGLKIIEFDDMYVGEQLDLKVNLEYKTATWKSKSAF